MRVHLLKHMDHIGHGFIDEWLQEQGHPYKVTRVHAGEPFPAIDEFDFLIILGGEMGVYEEEEHPWLIQEKQWIRKVIDSNKRILGICLGGQLIASSMGATVRKHDHSEIGWWPITFKEPAFAHPFLKGINEINTLFEFHYDTFEIPSEAVLLAESKACKRQAFAIGDRILGLQFHPEFNPEIVEHIVNKMGPKIKNGPFVEPINEMLATPERFESSKLFLYTLLNNIESHFNSEI